MTRTFSCPMNLGEFDYTWSYLGHFSLEAHEREMKMRGVVQNLENYNKRCICSFVCENVLCKGLLKNTRYFQFQLGYLRKIIALPIPPKLIKNCRKIYLSVLSLICTVRKQKKPSWVRLYCTFSEKLKKNGTFVSFCSFCEEVRFLSAIHFSKTTGMFKYHILCIPRSFYSRQFRL